MLLRVLPVGVSSLFSSVTLNQTAFLTCMWRLRHPQVYRSSALSARTTSAIVPRTCYLPKLKLCPARHELRPPPQPPCPPVSTNLMAPGTSEVKSQSIRPAPFSLRFFFIGERGRESKHGRQEDGAGSPPGTEPHTGLDLTIEITARVESRSRTLNGTSEHLPFRDSLTSLSTMPSRFTHGAAGVGNPSLPRLAVPHGPCVRLPATHLSVQVRVVSPSWLSCTTLLWTQVPRAAWVPASQASGAVSRMLMTC